MRAAIADCPVKALARGRRFAYFPASSTSSLTKSGPAGPLFLFIRRKKRRALERMEKDTASANTEGTALAAPAERFVRETGSAAELAALVEPVLEDMGFRLVRVAMSKRDGGTIQIMADKAGGAINVDDCAKISRRLSPLLDAHDPVEGRYFLEVSSPGIDRILVRPSDFEDWAGFETKVELKELIDGRKRFRGVLEGYENGEMLLQVQLDEEGEPQTIGLPVALIQDAKLVLTDELIRASLTKAKTAGKWSEGGEIEEHDIKEDHDIKKDAELNDGADRN